MQLDPQFLADVYRGSCPPPSEGSPAHWESHYKSDAPRLIAAICESQMAWVYSARKAESGKPSFTIRPKDNFISGTTNGYVAVFRHPDPVTERFADFTSRLSPAVPCLDYNAKMAHTTLAAWDFTPDRPDKVFKPEQDILDRLNSAAREIAGEVLQRVTIDFRGWLLTEDAVIAAGYPTPEFWTVAAQLWCAGAWKGLKRKWPWAAHMTAARFTEERQGKDVERVRGLVHAEPPLGKSQQLAIEVGWYECDRNKFKIHTGAGSG
jgi:hypothetical protein